MLDTLARVYSIAFSTLVCSCLASSGHAADYPMRPVELLATSQAGTSLDLTLRELAPLLSKEIGQPVAVVNKPGGSGTNAYSYINGNPADGYIVAGLTTTYSSAMAQQVGGFTGDELEGLCQLMVEAQAITVPANSPFKSVDDIVTFAKANPGKLRVSGGAGAAAYARLFGTAFQQKAGIEWTWIPFVSSPEVKRAFLGGDLDVVFEGIDGIEGGQMLAVTSDDRFSFAPDVPTLKELGYDIGNRVAWRGVFVRAGTPDDVKAVLIEALTKATKAPGWADFAKKLGAEEDFVCGPKFDAGVKKEISETRSFYKAVGIIE